MPSTPTRKDGGRSVIDAAEALRSINAPCYIVTTTGNISATLPVFYDLDEVAHRVYKVTKPTLYLIRPDGYVGARVSPHEVEKMKDYAGTWLPSGNLSLATGTPFRIATKLNETNLRSQSLPIPRLMEPV